MKIGNIFGNFLKKDSNLKLKARLSQKGEDSKELDIRSVKVETDIKNSAQAGDVLKNLKGNLKVLSHRFDAKEAQSILNGEVSGRLNQVKTKELEKTLISNNKNAIAGKSQIDYLIRFKKEISGE